VTTILFREYSPGVVTAVAVLLPSSACVLWRMTEDAVLATSQLVEATGIGVVGGALVVGSLWLRMDFDFRLRRPQS
jgi:hypothetical protein